MKVIRKPNYEWLIIVLFSILPVVDSINGILIRAGLPSVAILYKVFLMGVLMIPILQRKVVNAKVFGGMLFIVLYTVATMVVNYLLLRDDFIEITYPIKLLFNVITLVLLWSNIDNQVLSGNTIYKIFTYNVYLMLVCMLVPYVLGLGYTIYSGGHGYKAFFYSNNELNVVLIILFYFCLFKVAEEFSLVNLVLLGGIFICVLMMSTKSSIIVCAVGVVIFLLKCLKKIDVRIKILAVAAVGCVAFLARDFIWSQIQSFMGRQSGLFNVYSGDLLATITSGRMYYIEEALSEFVKRDFPIFHVLFGNGFISDVLTEMDFVDIFFYLGFVGVFAIIIGLLWIYYKSIPQFKRDKNGVRHIGFLLIMAFSFIAGHVLFMATSGCYFVLYCCFIMTYNSEMDDGRYEKYV